MKIFLKMRYIAIAMLLVQFAPAQRGNPDEVPLMRPDEEREVTEQAAEFNAALESILGDAAQSTVRIWGHPQRPRILAYGTVVGDGSQVLTKWSEVEHSLDSLVVQRNEEDAYHVTVEGVFSEEDLVLLNLEMDESAQRLVPAEFHSSTLGLGSFLTASQPNGKPAAFGVVSVLERNLRETDQAHLGVMADPQYRGEGVRIANVQPEYGAAEAGLREGDIILRIDDRTVSGLQELKNVLASKQPGDVVKMLIESAGKEREVEVFLSNRPVMGQFAGDRLNQMERMGGPINKVRDGFSRVVQSDMRINSNQIGGPVVDMEGKIVGITMARADRTRTYVMGGDVIQELLQGPSDTIAEARAKQAERQQMLARQQQELLPRIRGRRGGRGGQRPRSRQRMQRQLSDMERLMERMNDEMDGLRRR